MLWAGVLYLIKIKVSREVMGSARATCPLTNGSTEGKNRVHTIQRLRVGSTSMKLFNKL